MSEPNQRVKTSPSGQESARLPLPRVEDPLTLTIFGATGDLTHRKLMPALFAMFTEGLLPAEWAIVGYARRDYNDASFREWMADSIREFSRVEVEEESLQGFCSRLYYHRGDLATEDDFHAYRARLESEDEFPDNHLYYLSVAPSFFETVIDHLHQTGMVSSPGQKPWTRVVIEKPFGHDLDSALALNQHIRTQLHETQIYRIDHYLGKETVQNILSFRFANAIFEPLFNHNYVDHIEITASETVGMEKGRGAYFDATGCLRDMLQNHLLQLLCLVAMEPPANMTADAVRNEKVKVLQSITPMTPADVDDAVVRAQYEGYCSEDRVNPESLTESFVALRLELANWRWAGVPFYLRTGKRLKKRATEIRVEFKVPPLALFQSVACVGDVCDLTQTKPNVLTFRIQPDEGISLQFAAKRPALQMQVESVDMEFNYQDTWRKSLPEAYERLLLDVMRGDSTLFTRSDEVEAAWRILAPVQQRWAEDSSFPMGSYLPDSWGPAEADDLMPEGKRWADHRIAKIWQSGFEVVPS